MSHHVYTQTDRTTNLLISSNVHYVHLGGDNIKCFSVTIALRQAGRHHVSVSDRLDFVHVVLVNRRVEKEVQVVQKLNHLQQNNPTSQWSLLS